MTPFSRFSLDSHNASVEPLPSESPDLHAEHQESAPDQPRNLELIRATSEPNEETEYAEHGINGGYFEEDLDSRSQSSSDEHQNTRWGKGKGRGSKSRNKGKGRLDDRTRRYDSSTVPGVDPVLPTALVGPLRVTSKARGDIVSWRNQIALERRRYQDRRIFMISQVRKVEELADRIDNLLDSTHDSDHPIRVRLQSTIKELRNECDTVFAVQDELRRKEDMLESAELKVSAHDTALAKKELALLGQSSRSGPDPAQFPLRSDVLFDSFSFPDVSTQSTLQDDYDPTDDETSSEASEQNDQVALSAYSGSSQHTNPLEDEYYDHIGNVTLAREHLYNLQTDHLQNIYKRAALRKKGRNPSISETRFWQEYFTDRRKYIESYVNSKSEVERLYKACKDAGLDIEEPNLPPLIERTLDNSIRDIPKRVADAVLGSLASSADEENFVHSLEDPQVALQRRVKQWRHEMLKETMTSLSNNRPVENSQHLDDIWETASSASQTNNGSSRSLDHAHGLEGREKVVHSQPRGRSSFRGERVQRSVSSPILPWNDLEKQQVEAQNSQRLKRTYSFSLD
jgi:hypothetical protein